MSDLLATDDRSPEVLISQITDEFMQRLERGEQPEIEDYAGRYPEIAAVLRQVLPALQVLRGSGAPGASANAEVQPEGPLGDFRIVREIGRGGMGVVYEAVQISLGRRVALKVLPFAAALDAKHLQRFKNEAQAAAHLQHTNIVPVYYVGCERGVHYYAMQFIEGHTLATLIQELRQLAAREGTGSPASASAARALASDVASGRWAPASLPAPSAEAPTLPVAALSTERSTTNPAFFRTVAHLGVQAAEALEHAHQLGVIHRDIKPANLLVDAAGRLWVTDFGLAHYQTQPGLTLTGDLVGTLRYMSPERALARRVALDARTDIYSLGVTLYELLTLEPAYNGRNREELLRQIAFEEPRPPRRLNRAMPAELETIILKAMGKSPEERYTTAQELADDLRRFLEDKPIRARRATLLQRGRKWARRHQAVVVSAGVLLVVAVLALAVGSVLLTAAYQAETAQRRRAEAQEERARQAVDDMYTQVAEKWLAEQPNLQPVQRAFLLKALRFYEEFAQDPRTEPAVRRKAGEAYRRLAAIHHKLGDYPKAAEADVRALAVFEQLVADFPAVPDYREDLARACFGCGQHLSVTSRFQDAEQTYARALALWEELMADAPALPRYRHNQAQCRNHLGSLLLRTGRRGEAERAFRQARTALEKLVVDFPDEPAHARELAASCRYLGIAHHEAGRRDEAEEAFRQALAALQKLVDRFPANTAYLYDLARIYGHLGNVLLDTGRIPEAEPAYTQARAIFEQLVASFPAVPAYRHGLAFAYDKLGFLHLRDSRSQDAMEDFGRARQLREKLVGDFPHVADHQNALAEVLQHLAMIAYNQGEFDEASRLVDRAISHEQLALKANPRNRDYRLGLKTGYWIRAHVLVQQGRHADAARAAADISRCGFNPDQDAVDAVEVLTFCASLAEDDVALPRTKRQEMAQAYLQQAQNLLREAERTKAFSQRPRPE